MICNNSIAVHKIASSISQCDLIFDRFWIFYGHLALPQQYKSILKNDVGDEKIRHTIQVWVEVNGSKATVGTLCTVFENMELQYICEKLLEPINNQHVCSTCVVVLQEQKNIASEIQPLLNRNVPKTITDGSQQGENDDNNNRNIITMSAEDLVAVEESHASDPNQNVKLCKKLKKLISRPVMLSLTATLLTLTITIIAYSVGFMHGKSQCSETANDSLHAGNSRNLQLGTVGEHFELDTSLKPKLVTEDDIMQLGQYCKRQPRRAINLSLGKLVLFPEPLSVELSSCLLNIKKLNITGPMKPDVLKQVLFHTLNLKELVLYRMEKFCRYSEDYLPDPPKSAADHDHGGSSSVVKLVFQGFTGNCATGINAISYVINTRNLFSIGIVSCDFGDTEILEIKKLVVRSPNLMHFSCCGVQQVHNFKLMLNELTVFMENNDCMILNRI